MDSFSNFPRFATVYTRLHLITCLDEVTSWNTIHITLTSKKIKMSRLKYFKYVVSLIHYFINKALDESIFRQIKQRV